MEIERSPEMAAFLAEQLKEQHNETRRVLDALRRSRKSRGGVGTPLEVPAHLRGPAAGAAIVVTDADLKEETSAEADRELFRERVVTTD